MMNAAWRLCCRQLSHVPCRFTVVPQNPIEAIALSDKRRHSRYEVTAYVDYSGTEVLLYHHIENISLGGICIQTTDVEEIGTKVDLIINFPDLDSSVATQGEVAWVNRDEPMDVGIRFLDLDDARKDILRKYLAEVKKKRANR